jgi:Protein of unknown function (DUF3833)
MLFSRCRTKTSYYDGSTPTLDLQTFFVGPMKAWGIVQNLRGHIVQRLDIDMFGRWNDNQGVLDETIRYSNGREEKRTWNLLKNPDGTFSGTAEGIRGVAKGESSGYATRWNYTMTILADGKKINVCFDDWMFAMNDKILVNRAYMKKFGITLAEISIFIMKQDQPW